MSNIAIVRIKGRIGIDKNIVNTLERLKVHKKYACSVFINPTPSIKGMIKKVNDFVALGELNDEEFKTLVEKRGRLIDKTKKTDLKKAAEEILKGKKYEEANIKPFFRLHSPRGGIDTKNYFGHYKGVLGNHKNKINLLIKRML